MSEPTPKELLLPELNLPRVSFSRRRAKTPEESRETHVVWGAKSLDEIVTYADRLLRNAPKHEEGIG
jgi:hypothetical protein